MSLPLYRTSTLLERLTGLVIRLSPTRHIVLCAEARVRYANARADVHQRLVCGSLHFHLRAVHLPTLGEWCEHTTVGTMAHLLPLPQNRTQDEAAENVWTNYSVILVTTFFSMYR
jgi:hypothetical protein